MGGFFGPEIRFAGYDGLMIRGRADRPVYLRIDDDRVRIEDASRFWGMGTDAFDRALIAELGDRRYRTCYIGPAGENLVPFACIINTAARAAGRGGTGCVMGSKNLKAIAIKGSRQPDVASHQAFLDLLEEIRGVFLNKAIKSTTRWRRYGTSMGLEMASDAGAMAVKNYREGTYETVDRIGGIRARRQVWNRDYACFACPLACKKSGWAPLGPHSGLVHDGPEYETGAMLGPNLLIDDMSGLLRSVFMADDLGLDAIAAGNAIGFLMEARDKGLIDTRFLDGLDLKWGDSETVHPMLERIARREGVGRAAGDGVKHLAGIIGRDSHKFAIHSKGHAFAAWNCHYRPSHGLCYATSNRGACHINGHTAADQNQRALDDSIGLCIFAKEAYSNKQTLGALEAISGRAWSGEDYLRAGERMFNLEKCFNYREGFRREDDVIPDRFFEEPLTVGPRKGAVVDRGEFEGMMKAFYESRGWDPATTRPSDDRLKSLGLDFAIPALDT